MFLFAKLVNLLLNPALWVLIILIVAWLSRNPYRRRRWLAAGLGVFLFFSNPYIIQRLIQAYQWPPKAMEKGEQYEAGILLGGMMGYDPAAGDAFFNGSSDRFIQTLKLYKQGHIRKIIVSGGNAMRPNSSFREADYLAGNLLAMGVPAADIWRDRDARNTVENAQYAHRILDSMGIRTPVVVVTSSWHMPRAVKIFEAEGLAVRPYPANYIAPPSNRRFGLNHLLPSGDAMGHWNLYLKEWVGQLAIRVQRKGQG
jgi:uncharacterized SAM-binding protein YcdF (DUF218 family)